MLNPKLNSIGQVAKARAGFDFLVSSGANRREVGYLAFWENKARFSQGLQVKPYPASLPRRLQVPSPPRVHSRSDVDSLLHALGSLLRESAILRYEVWRSGLESTRLPPPSFPEN